MARPNRTVPRLRFRGFENNTLSYVEANQVFAPISDKGYPDLPVLSASQEEGMVERNDTNRDISYKQENTVGYKRICPKQFAIHLRSFQGGFAHSAIEGITSPAYTILGFKNNKHDDLYWKQLLTSKRFIWELRKVTYGMRDGRSINVEEFFKLRFAIPSLEEQEKVGAFFQALDELIEANEAELQKLRQLKAALLEAMFPADGSDTPASASPDSPPLGKRPASPTSHRLEEG